MPTIRYPIQYSPIDNPKPNLDYRYGPWESEDAYLDTGNIPVKGLTIGINQEDGTIKEMWYVVCPEDSTKLILVEKNCTSEQVQSDWTESDPTNPAYILHKPTISGGGQGSTQIPLLGNVKVTATAATSGQTTGVAVTAGQNGEITMAFTLEKGTNGINGKSAYQVWLDEGNEGSEVDFLNSLKAHVSRFIPIATEASAASLNVGDTYAFSNVPNPTDGAMLLMPNGDTTTPKTLMFSVTSNGDTPETFTYTYVGELSISAEGFISSDKIVNNLTTGGADKVPSAEAVKGLNASLYGSDVEVVGEPISISSDMYGIFLNQETDTWLGGSVGVRRSRRITIPDGTSLLRFTVQTGYSRKALYTFTKKRMPASDLSFDQLVSDDYLCNDVASYTDILKGNYSSGDEVELQVPNGAKYLYFVMIDSSGKQHPVPLTVTPVSTLHNFGDVERLLNMHVPEVVDNLDTDDATKALSAARGKVLADLTLQTVVSDNLLDPSTIRVGRNVKRTNGDEVSNSGVTDHVYGCTDFIELPDEGIYCDNVSIQAGSYVGAAVVYTENKVFAAYVSNSTNHWIAIDPTDHPTWKYVRFNIYTNGNTGVYKGTSFHPYTPWFAPYKKLKNAEIADGSVTLDKLAFTKVVCGKNKLNPAMMRAAHTAVRYTDGAIVSLGSSQNYRATGLIQISQSGLIANHTPTSPGSIHMGYAVYGSDGVTFVRGVVASGSTAAYVFDPKHDPVDGFVRFTMSSDWQNLQVEEGGTVTDYESYTEHKVISSEALPTTNRESEEERIEVLLPDRFYFVSGDTLQLFYKGMICSIDLSDKYVKPTFSGNNNESTCQFKRYFEIGKSYARIGSFRLEINVYNDAKTSIAYGKTSIKTCAIPSTLPSWSHEKHILVIGDSMTDFPSDNKRSWLWECGRRLLGPANDSVPKIGEVSFPKGSGLSNIKFIGSQTKSGDALHGENNATVTVRAFAKSGWGWKDYYDNNRKSKSVRFYLQEGQSYDEGYVFTNNGVSYTIQELNIIDGQPTIKCNASTTLTTTNKPVKTGDVYILVGTDGHADINANSYEIDPANPFWNTEKEGGAGLDIQNYLDSVGKENTSDAHGYVDIVYFVLSWNNWVSNGSNFKTYIRAIIDQFNEDCNTNQGYLPQIVLVLPGIPSMEVLMKGYGTLGTESDTYLVVRGMFEIGSLYKEVASEYDNVTFESWAAQFDSDYGYGWINESWANSAIKDVNTRYSGAKEPYATNTIHPNNIGYMQMADACYRSIVCRLYGS